MKQKTDHSAAIFLSILISTATYYYALRAMPGILNDYNGHMYVYLPMFTQENVLAGWQTVPYCMWHLCVLALNKIFLIPLEISGAFTSCAFSSLTFFITYWMIRRITAAAGNLISPYRAAFITFGLSLAQAIYLPWLDAGDCFLGVYSINPIHNPTQMCVKPFSLLCFCLVYDIWGMQQNSEYKGIFFTVEKGLKKYYILLSVMLLLSTIAKPTFAEMFIPAVGIIMLCKWLYKIRHKDTCAPHYFKHCIHMFLCALPALFYILLQFADYYILGHNSNSETEIIITEWLEVWKMFSENIPLSVLLGMAFPLFVILIDIRFFFRSNMGKLALTGYVISFFEAALLGEGGIKLSHSNFLWPLMSAMLILWVVSIFRLLVLECAHTQNKFQTILLNCAWGLFWIHVFYGFAFVLSYLCAG